MTNQLFGLNFCVVQQDTFYHHQDYDQVNFYQKWRLYIIGWSVRDGKIAIYLHLFNNWNLSTKICQNFFLSTLPATLGCYAKRH